MGAAVAPKKVKLFCGVISSDGEREIKRKSFEALKGRFGEIDLINLISTGKAYTL